jgi:hypothetical protein
VTDQLRLVPTGPHDASMIVPVIKRQAPPSDDDILLPPEFDLMSDALVDDLNVFYVFDIPGYFKYVSEHDRKALKLNTTKLRLSYAMILVWLEQGR